ncbi:MAG: acid--CoA ligase, partial [Bauldia litoralis]
MTPFPPEHIRRHVDAGAWGTDTLWDLFRRNAAAEPERLALVDDPRKAEDCSIARLCRLTYRDLEREILA